MSTNNDFYSKAIAALETISGDSENTSTSYYEKMASALEKISQTGFKGSPQLMYAALTVDTSSGESVYHCDKTLAQLLAAINNGTYIVMKSGDSYLPLAGYSSTKVVFQDFEIASTKMNLRLVQVEAEDAVTLTEKSVTLDT